jgi:hypothetical protein
VCRELKIAVGDILDWTIEQRKNRKFARIRKMSRSIPIEYTGLVLEDTHIGDNQFL